MTRPKGSKRQTAITQTNKTKQRKVSADGNYSDELESNDKEFTERLVRDEREERERERMLNERIKAVEEREKAIRERERAANEGLVREERERNRALIEREKAIEEREKATRETERVADDNNDEEIVENERENLEKEKRRGKEKRQEDENTLSDEDGGSLPQEFQAMGNQLQICNWLVNHPNILHLANEMLAAKSSTTSSTAQTVISTPSDTNDSYRLFDEELKCLFLRSRNPKRAAYEQLVCKVFGLNPYKKDAERLIHDASKKFTDYRNKFNEIILSLVSELRKTDRVNQGNLVEEVNEFISEEVVMKKILRRQLAVVDINELTKNSSLEKLVEFSRESFKVHWGGKNIDAIKPLDRITKNSVIPSRSGHNIANSIIID